LAIEPKDVLATVPYLQNAASFVVRLILV
jgi:hypothetical protein